MTDAGCASWMMSAALPPLRPTLTCVSWKPDGTSATWMSMPVAASNGAIEARKDSPSPSIHWFWMTTLVPANGWSSPRAMSSSA